MTYLTYYGYEYNGKKWKYRQYNVKNDMTYEETKEYAKGMFARLLKLKHFSIEGIAVSKENTEKMSSKEIHNKDVYSKRKKGERKYRTNEESLGTLQSYIIYYSNNLKGSKKD